MAASPALPPAPGSKPLPQLAGVRLHGWRHPAILAATALSLFAGFAQFGVAAALADVAAEFGEPVTSGTSIAAQVGLSGTTLGVGLALIRLASLGALPLAGVADRLGRRRVLLTCCAAGLAMTFVAAFSPSYWWFVVIFAVGRPLMSATNAVAGVIAAEETSATDRAKAMALIIAGYGTGAGMPVVIRGVLPDISFRVLFGLAAVLLLLVPLVGRIIEEPDRHARLQLLREDPAVRARLGHVAPALRPRLLLVAGMAFAIAFVTGPVNTNVFVYGELVLGLSPGVFGVLVVPAAALGVAGLLLGRWSSDRFGRRSTAAVTHVGVALVGALTYNAGAAGAVTGYLSSLFVASTYGTAFGALSAEVFPTSVRATAAGWLTAAGTLGAVAGLLAFGSLADALGTFGAAAVLVCAPVAVAAVGYLWLPETRGLELEQSAPEPV